jgi:hypothetical protein
MRLLGLIFFLLVLIWFLNRQGEEPSDNKNSSVQIEKAGAVSNEQGRLSTASSSTASVKKVNSVPVIKSIRLLPIPVSAGQAVQAEVITEDKDGDFVHLIYAWQVNGKPVDANDLDTLSGDRVHSADKILVFVIPADPYSRGSATVSPLITVINLSPDILSLPPNKDDKGKYTYQIVAKDPDLDTLNYLLIKGPPGMEVDSVTGLVQWTVAPLSESQSRIALEVNDGKGGKVTQKFTLQTSPVH